MNDREAKSEKETRQENKRLDEEAKSLAREKKARAAYSAREEALQKTTDAKEKERAKKRAAEKIKELERENARKEAYLANEEKIALEQQKRKSQNNG